MPLFVTLSLSILGGVLLLLLIWLLAAAPRRRRAETEFFASTLYAHRGLHSEKDGIPENSLPAFARAVGQGLGIELDVQLSADGVPMVFHDKTLERVCGVQGVLSQKTAAELSELTLLGCPDCNIPTLAEVLALVGGRVPLLVEIKEHPSPLRSAAAAASLLDGYDGSYCVEAFHPFALLWFRRHRPRVIRGQLSAAFLRDRGTRGARYAILHLFLLNFLSRPDFIAYDLHHRSSPVIRILRALFGVPLFGWTAKTAEEYRTEGFDTMILEGAPDDIRGGDRT